MTPFYKSDDIIIYQFRHDVYSYRITIFDLNEIVFEFYMTEIEFRKLIKRMINESLK